MDIKKLIPYLFPPEVVEYFKVTEIKEVNNQLYIHLDEKNITPRSNLESKGFYPAKTIQDFPLRDRAVFLMVKRRRWRDKDTGEEIMKDFKVEKKGSKYTKEFADFLKELFGSRTSTNKSNCTIF